MMMIADCCSAAGGGWMTVARRLTVEYRKVEAAPQIVHVRCDTIEHNTTAAAHAPSSKADTSSSVKVEKANTQLNTVQKSTSTVD